jgi:hypothetical protein
MFVNKCVNTIDSYGLGVGLCEVLAKMHAKMETDLVNRLSLLFQDMIQSSLNRRADINAALVQYERIMEDSGILREFGKHFENHELVDDDKKTQNLETKIEKAVESAKLISEKDVQNQLKKDPEALNPIPIVPPVQSKKGRCPREHVRIRRENAFRRVLLQPLSPGRREIRDAKGKEKSLSQRHT